MAHPSKVEIAPFPTSNDTRETQLLVTSMASLEPRIYSGRTDRQDRGSSSEIYRAGPSPVKRLPPEILGQVFVYTLTSDLQAPVVSLPGSLGPRARLVTLCLVCRSWRRAALVTHSLWSSITIGPGPPFAPSSEGDPEQYAFDRVEKWLSRAGSTMKSLNVCGKGLGTRVVDEMLVQGPAFERVRLECAVNLDPMRALLATLRRERKKAAPEGRLPWDSVRHLELDFHFADWLVDGLELPADRVLEDLPLGVTSLQLRLPPQERAFRMFGDPPAFHIPSIPVRLSPDLLGQLVSLEFSCDWDGSHLLHLLAHCRSLEELTSVDTTDALLTEAEGWLEDGERVVLENLRTLRLKGRRDLPLLRYIRTPALLELSIDCKQADPTIEDFVESLRYHRPLAKDAIDSLMRFMEASGTKDRVERLVLCWLGIEVKDLKTIILGFGGLKKLTLEEVGVDYQEVWDGVQSHIRETGAEARHSLAKLDVVEIKSHPMPDFFSDSALAIQACEVLIGC